MSKHVYLVDTENVGPAWIQLVPRLRKKDKMYLFYTKASMKFSFEDMDYLMQYRNNLRFVACFNGHANALDFQLATMSGVMFKKHPKREYVVVSCDGGYDSMISFMRIKGQKIKRLNIEDLSFPVVETVKPKPVGIISDLTVAKVLKISVDNRKSHVIATVVQQELTRNTHDQAVLQAVHNRLQKKFGNRQGSMYYRQLRQAGLLRLPDDVSHQSGKVVGSN